MPKIIPFNDLPTPKGKYSVGTQIFTWTDNSRDEWFTKTENDKRKLVVQIWYPTNIKPTNTYPYIDNPEKRLGPILYQLGLPLLLVKHMQNIKTNSMLNAPIHTQLDEIPVILFSHGLGGMKSQNSIQIEELVSQGYFVIAPDHPFDANITIFDDGTTADYRSGITYLQAIKGKNIELTEQDYWDFRLPQIQTRTADIKFILDTLTTLKHAGQFPWKAMNLDKVGMFGHSFGGATSIMASYNDSRIDACIVFDAWLVPIPQYIIDEGLTIPFLYIGRPIWETPLNYEKLNTLLSSSSTHYSNKIFIDGTTHFDFSDTPHFSSLSKNFGISGKTPSNEILQVLNNNLSEFFDKYLETDFE